MDPLSITAAIGGLLSAAGKAQGLLETISSSQNAPTTIRDVQRETRHTEIALRSLHRFLQRLDPASERLERIQVDELRVVLADAMLLFSSFESMLEALADLGRLHASISWTRYTKQLDDHLGKLERYKSSLTFMLTILQCHSDSESRANQAQLQGLVEQILTKNGRLRHQMQTSQDSFDARSMAARRPENDTATVRFGDNSTTRGSVVTRRGTVRSTIDDIQNSIIRFAFENILEGSRVYKRTAHIHECDQSFNSSVIRSVFSGYSLADISALSVIAMPFCIADVSNRGHYVAHVELDRQTSITVDLEIRTPEVANATAITEATEKSVKPESSAQRMSAHLATAKYLVESSNTHESRHSEATSPQANRPMASAEIDSMKQSWNPLYSHPASLAALASALADPNSSEYSFNSLEDLDSEIKQVYSCENCNEIVTEDSKTFELAGCHWHLNCLRCSICNTLIEDSDVLFRRDGTLVCKQCTPDCFAACEIKINDLGIIIQGGQIFCPNCFRCWNCRRKIEDRKYGMTSYGFLCKSCHEVLRARRKETRRKQQEAGQAQGSAQDASLIPSTTVVPGGVEKSLRNQGTDAEGDAEVE